ncbi:MAG: hypothetical protein WAN87_08355 [Thermoplasmata archaeon]
MRVPRRDVDDLTAIHGRIMKSSVPEVRQFTSCFGARRDDPQLYRLVDDRSGICGRGNGLDLPKPRDWKAPYGVDKPLQSYSVSWRHMRRRKVVRF